MDRLWGTFKAFWGAEEIPRSIGMLLVLVYLVTLGAIGISAQQRVREYARLQVAGSKEQAIRLLADVLEPASVESAGGLQATLQRFARAHDCAELRVYDRELKVLASLSSVEVGQSLDQPSRLLPLRPTALNSLAVPGAADEQGTLLACVPLRDSGHPASQFVEGVFALRTPTALADSLNLWTLVIALACTGAFLLVYRRLRQHFRSFAQISDRLVNNADHFQQRLPELSLHEVYDEVARCWNKLIDLTMSLEEEVARSTASAELLAALDKTKTGELAEAMIAVPIGVILVSDQGRVMYSNAMASRLIGWPLGAEDTPALDDEDLSADGRQIVEHIRSRLDQDGSFHTLDTQIEGDDGSYYHVQIGPVRTPQQSHRFVVLILDVSQQVRADKAREEFVSAVTHELRTPLTNIRAYAETLSSGMFDDPQVITECYNVITKETRRLSRLIEDVLSVSQLEVGTMQLVLDDVDLRPLLTEAVRDVRGIAETKGLDLQLALPPKLAVLRGDRDKLAVLINNLLGNALKYTPEGGQVVLSCQAEGNQVRVSVRDTGIGIDPQDHNRVFEKFQRGADDAVQNETGTGIGLTTALEIARQHGGDITVVSKKGEGATFTFSMPVQERSPVAVEAV